VNKKKDEWEMDKEHYDPDDTEDWGEDRLGDEYKDFIWEKMIAKERPDLKPEDEEYQALKLRMDEAWQKEGEMTNYADALEWLEGMNKIPVEQWDEDLDWMNTEKATRIFSCLGAKLLEMSCSKLGINYESLTIERKLAATSAVKDYTSIIAWIAGNAEAIEKKEPYGTE
jgi:hypothetical protein